MAQLSNKALDLLKKDEEMQIAIGKLFNPARKIRTIKRWIAENDERLTIHDSLTLIKSAYGLTETDMLEENELAKAV